MRSWLETSQSLLAHTALKSLRNNLVHNRSTLPPSRLPQVAEQLLLGLRTFLDEGKAEAAQALGGKLGQQGLGLRSLLALSRAWVGALCGGTAAPEDRTEPAPLTELEQLHDFLTLLVEGLSAHELQAFLLQRDEFQATLDRVVREREEAQRSAMRELWTPIMPLHEGLLAVPLVGAIDRERANGITERLLTEVANRRARIVLLDITGVPAIDQEVAAALLRAVRSVELLGARAVLTGIRPDMALSLCKLGIPLDDLNTHATTQSGIAWALGELDLSPAGKTRPKAKQER